MTDYTTTRGEYDCITRIAGRAADICKRLGQKVNQLHVCMDLSATHANGCPLDFEALLRFPETDFVHDVFGIERHLDRKTGKLQNCFVPRCARKQ